MYRTAGRALVRPACAASLVPGPRGTAVPVALGLTSTVLLRGCVRHPRIALPSRAALSRLRVRALLGRSAEGDFDSAPMDPRCRAPRLGGATAAFLITLIGSSRFSAGAPGHAQSVRLLVCGGARILSSLRWDWTPVPLRYSPRRRYPRRVDWILSRHRRWSWRCNGLSDDPPCRSSCCHPGRDRDPLLSYHFLVRRLLARAQRRGSAGGSSLTSIKTVPSMRISCSFPWCLPASRRPIAGAPVAFRSTRCSLERPAIGPWRPSNASHHDAVSGLTPFGFRCVEPCAPTDPPEVSIRALPDHRLLRRWWGIAPSSRPRPTHDFPDANCRSPGGGRLRCVLSIRPRRGIA